MELEYLPFKASEIPVEKIFDFGGVNYRFKLSYNEEGGFYSLLISSAAGEPLYATRLCYGCNAIRAVVPGLKLNAKLVPVDPQDIISEIPIRTDIPQAELGAAVKLYVIREAEDG